MKNLRDYGIVTGAYWAFTLTDGALRMLVLLHLHDIGYSPFEIASLFLFYEFFGVVTNLLGGWIGARIGLKPTLTVGLGLQVISLGLLAANSSSLSVPLVLVAQALSGTAKDLTKMSSKSYVKLVVPDGDQRGLMRLVALLTGSKNTLKGLGFFLGGWLLTLLGFRVTCLAMAAALLLALSMAALTLPPAVGRTKRKINLKHLISRDARINWLSAARLFLFGARDVWFVLALPVFLSSSLGWSHAEVGGALALWVIGYGLVQALAPLHVGTSSAGDSGDSSRAGELGGWTLALVIPLGGMIGGLLLGAPVVVTLVSGLVLFGAVFATNSAIHSYLIVAYADADRVALSVGFYYMSNAAGRLIGTLLSGVLYQMAGQGQAGLNLCLAASLLFVVVSFLFCLRLTSAEDHLEPRAEL